MLLSKKVRPSRTYNHRNSFEPIAKQITVHADMTATGNAMAAKPAPSLMTARSASFNAVRGNAEMIGCDQSGKFDDEKKTPEKR